MARRKTRGRAKRVGALRDAAVGARRFAWRRQTHKGQCTVATAKTLYADGEKIAVWQKAGVLRILRLPTNATPCQRRARQMVYAAAKRKATVIRSEREHRRKYGYWD